MLIIRELCGNLYLFYCAIQADLKKRYKLEIDSVGGKDNKINLGEIKEIKYKKGEKQGEK